MPLVSIVLPTHNGEAFIQASVKSCLDQTFRDFELIIVDDASSDATPKIAAELASSDPRITVVTNTTNLKLPASLNAGFSMARGEFLTWTSDDNLYAPTAIEKLLHALHAHPQAGLAYADEVLINEAGNEFSRRKREPFCYLLSCNVVGACFLYRREIAEKIGEYDTTRFLSEDYDYWLRIGSVSPFIHVAEFLYSYRMHKGNLTSQRHEEIQHRALKSRIQHALKIRSIPPRWRQQGALSIARTAWLQQLPWTAFRFALSALAISPEGALLAIFAKLRGRSSLPPVPEEHDGK